MAEANQIQVRLVTPDRILVDQSATAVELPATFGLHGGAAGACSAALRAGLGRGSPSRRRSRRAEISRLLGICGSAAGAGDHPRRRSARSRKRSTPPRRSRSSTKATRCGTKPATAKRNTPRRTKSSPTQNRSWPARGIRARGTPICSASKAPCLQSFKSDILCKGARIP